MVKRKLACGVTVYAKDKRELALKITNHAIYAHAGKYPVVSCHVYAVPRPKG